MDHHCLGTLLRVPPFQVVGEDPRVIHPGHRDGVSLLAGSDFGRLHDIAALEMNRNRRVGRGTSPLFISAVGSALLLPVAVVRSFSETPTYVLLLKHDGRRLSMFLSDVLRLEIVE